MILESALLDVLPGQEDAFLAAFAGARPLIAAQRGFRSLELRRCLDAGGTSRFLLQVGWDTLEDHTEGFRRSPEYGQWRELLHRFYDPFPTVEHYGEPLLTA
ncbi:antibiotic biosynthesis monooxygenase family protein [Kitasatospora sp. NPDC057198]|uniref:antibiotic biosynthesis monooxygenase family protein n=1 Tax=Kitasatospora sp. NPDC057198 TaxID=3346046 RepID=UPI003630F4DF